MVKLSTAAISDRVATPAEIERIVRVRKYADQVVDFLEAELGAFSEQDRPTIVNTIGEWVQKKKEALALVAATHNRQKKQQSPETPSPNPPKRRSPQDAAGDVSDAMEQCERIISMAESGDIPEEGQEFCEDVAKSVRGVLETIERCARVTAKQQAALDGWEAGVGNWAARGEW